MRRSSIIVVAMLSLLLTSAAPVAGLKLMVEYQLDASCISSVDGWNVTLSAQIASSKQQAHSLLRAFIADEACVRNTVEYTIAPIS